MNDQQTTPAMKDAAYGGRMWAALGLALGKAAKNFVTLHWRSAVSVLVSAFITAYGTAVSRSKGIAKLWYLPLRLLFGCAAGTCAMLTELIGGSWEQFSADQLDVLSAAYIGMRRYKTALDVIEEALGPKHEKKPNTSALLWLRRADSYAGIYRYKGIDYLLKRYNMRVHDIDDLYKQIVEKIEEFDPENRSRPYRSLALWAEHTKDMQGAIGARIKAIRLADGYPDQLEKARSIKFDWE